MLHKINDFVHFWKEWSDSLHWNRTPLEYYPYRFHWSTRLLPFKNIPCIRLETQVALQAHEINKFHFISFRFVWNSLCIRKWDRTNSNGSKWKILNEISRLHSKHICKYFEMYVFLSNVTHFPFYDHRCWELGVPVYESSSVLYGNIIQNKERITFSSTARIRHSSIKFCLVSPAHFHSATAQIHTEQPTAFRVHWQSICYATTTTTTTSG